MLSTYNDSALRVTWSVPDSYHTSNTTVKMLVSASDDGASERTRTRTRRADSSVRDLPVILTKATDEKSIIGGLKPFSISKIRFTVLSPNGTELYSREAYGVSSETGKFTAVWYPRGSFILVSL